MLEALLLPIAKSKNCSKAPTQGTESMVSRREESNFDST